MQVAGKLEIRVVPKETSSAPRSPPPAQRPQTLSPPSKPPQNIFEHTNGGSAPPQPPMIKLERTKSILKQGSKERCDHPELHSPKRENITFAPEHNLEKHLQEKESRKLLEKKVSVEEVARPEAVAKDEEEEEESESSSETSSSEEEEEEDAKEQAKPPSPPVRRISVTRSNSRINFEPVESLEKQKKAPKPAIEKIRRGLVDSKSESSSSTSERNRNCGKCAKSLLKTPERGQCSPSIEVTSNPAVTFVSAAQEQR